MRRRAATVALATVLALIAVAPAEAATLTLTGSTTCYRVGDVLTASGSGFTPSGQASLTIGGREIATTPTDAVGNFSKPLIVGQLTGTSTRTLTATDAVNPANVATAQLLGSALAVIVSPRNGAAARKLRIKAMGFTTGKRLYAHVVRKRIRRNVFIGKLKGPCRTLEVRRRELSDSLPSGQYKVQFDTRRRYSKKTRVGVSFRVTVTPNFAGAGLLGQSRLTQTVLFSR